MINNLKDRLEIEGSPQSVNNGQLPKAPNADPSVPIINNTFAKGTYKDTLYDIPKSIAGGRVTSRFK
jgi:hypothetical protein